jgi:hypothetical protein
MTAPTGRFERTINVVLDGKQIVGTLVSGDLQQQEDGSWSCLYSIPGISEEAHRMVGKDPLAAFAKTLGFVSALIRGHISDGIPIWWKTHGDCGGF